MHNTKVVPDICKHVSIVSSPPPSLRHLIVPVSHGEKRKDRNGCCAASFRWRERKREGRQTEIPRLSRLVYYGRKSLRLSHCSINHLARKRALIIARYQICIRLHSARFFALTLLPFPYPFDINQFGRLLCVLRFIFLFFFSFCRKWIFGCFSSIREIFLFSFIEDSWNFISHVEILIRQIRISRKLIKRSVSVSCQGVW